MSEDNHETKPLRFGAQATEQAFEAQAEADADSEVETEEQAVADGPTEAQLAEQDEQARAAEAFDEQPVPSEEQVVTMDGGEGSTEVETEADIVQQVEATQETNQTEVEGAVLADAPNVAQDEPVEVPEIAAEQAEGEESIDVLRQRQNDLDAQIKARQNAEKVSVLNQIKTVVTTYNISVQELVDHLGGLKKTRAGTKAKPKYRDPATGKEWSGRGKEPLWIKGQNRDSFLITE